MAIRAVFHKIVEGSKKPIVAVSCLFFTIWLMGVLTASNFFWQLLNHRFSQDARYQAQTIFLPDQARSHDLLIVGDSLFLSSLPKNLTEKGSTLLQIDGYDPNDLAIVGSALQFGKEITDTRICTVLVQVSPLFAIRAKAFGKSLDISLLKDKTKRRDLSDDVKYFFEVIETWGASEKSGVEPGSDPLRPTRLVGQARFADPNDENWERAFEEVLKHDGAVIGVFDTRGTDWGIESDVVKMTRQRLDALARSDDGFSWLPLDRIEQIAPAGCPPR